MANLKELKNRITSVKSTQKITSAMKMVAASRLKRAQDAAEVARPYAEKMTEIMSSVLDRIESLDVASKLLIGTGSDSIHLIIVVTSDRGLCGGFNSSISRESRKLIRSLEADGKKIKILCIGKKGRDQLKMEFEKNIIDCYEGIGKTGVDFSEAQTIAGKLIEMFDEGSFDECTLIYNRFISVISQEVTVTKIIPVQSPEKVSKAEITNDGANLISAGYEYEPTEEEILDELLPQNLCVRVFSALLESSASEHGARMSAMDNATRNAGEMIDDLSMIYNRSRQAKITSELIEIISGAEAL
ncbi:MAG: F0F1 ATP synthase subunit gamma [Rhodospirillales bacterium]|tara:strand:- start:169 stop:1071 length:903 start_codon:yes stop_codon:yes gene_type:complete